MLENEAALLAARLNPKHYRTPSGKQVIDLIEQANLDYAFASALAYVLRHVKKNGVEDLHKARWYLQRVQSKPWRPGLYQEDTQDVQVFEEQLLDCFLLCHTLAAWLFRSSQAEKQTQAQTVCALILYAGMTRRRISCRRMRTRWLNVLRRTILHLDKLIQMYQP